MSDLVKEMLSKFVDLAQEEKQIAVEMDAAYKEYNEYCAGSEKDLNKKIDEIHEKMNKLNYYVDYAREHANAAELEEAAAPFDTSDGMLESIRQTIKLDSRNDSNAESLYTKATGKKLFYEEKIEQTRKLIDGSKIQAKRQYDSEVAKINKRKDEHFERVRDYVQSRDFADYLKMLIYDKSAFNSPGTVKLNDEDHISLGQRRVKLSVPMEIEQDLALSSNGEYNAAARTVGAPYQVLTKKGSVLFLEHDERNNQYLLGGVQRLLLNFIKYFGSDLTSVVFCEPEHFNVESLGNISALGKGINPFITVPKSAEEIEGKIKKLTSKIQSAPTRDKVSRILVLQNFPEKYSPETAREVLELCKNAENSGLLVIMTHQVPMNATPVETEIRALAEVIRSRNGGFWVEKYHESLFWYSAPSDLSDEVRRVYVEKRRQDAVKAAQNPVEKPEQPAQPAQLIGVAEPEKQLDTNDEFAAFNSFMNSDTPDSSAFSAVSPTEPLSVDDTEQLAADDELAPPEDTEQLAADDELAPMEDMEQLSADDELAPPEDTEQLAADDELVPPEDMEQLSADDDLAPMEDTEEFAADEELTAMEDMEQLADDEYAPMEDTAQFSEDKEAAAVEEDEPADNFEEQYSYEQDNVSENAGSALNDAEDDVQNEERISENEPLAQLPQNAEKDVTVTMVSEFNDELPPPFDPLAPRDTPQNYGKMGAPTAPAPDFRPEQNIDPDMTYKITDRNKPKAPEAANGALASDFRSERKMDPDMTYKITDRNKPKAPEAANAAPAPDFRSEQKIDPDMTYRITDRNKLKAPEAANGAPSLNFRPEQNIEPDMTYRITDRNKPRMPEMSGGAPAPDFRSEQKITSDMTYRITDHPPKPQEPTPVVEKSRNPIKGVIGAGKRKLEQFVDNRKSDPSSKRLASGSETAAVLDPSNAYAQFEEPMEDDGRYAINRHYDRPREVQRVVEDEEEPVEDIYGKGVRKLPQIPLGKTVEGNFVKLDISGNVTYICGARGDRRKNLTERVIAQITADTHPDDVELWMLDCGDGELMKYAEEPTAHMKYLVSDTGAETSIDFTELIAAELEHRVDEFSENGWSSVEDIPADTLMPVIVVAINTFPRFAENITGTSKYFGRNYDNKLTRLFKNCANYGIHFVLIGNVFSDDGKRPACFEGCTLHSGIVLEGKDHAAHKLFSGIRLYDNEVESLKKVPSGCAFTADESSTNGLTLVRLGGENAINEHTYKAVSGYSENLEEFADKHPFIGDRKTASKFEDRREFREKRIAERAENEYLLFLGEPCRFMGEYPVRLYDDFGENLLAIAPAREKNNATLMVRAALISLNEQGLKTEILACRSNPVYNELERCGALEGLDIYEGDRAEERVMQIVEMLENNERPDVFEIVLGGDLLVASMHADDMIGVLKKALVKGPRNGAHFMFISGSAGTAAAGFLSLFRHKMVFACPYSEAEKILRDPNCDLPENGFRLSNDYDELTILPYSM